MYRSCLKFTNVCLNLAKSILLKKKESVIYKIPLITGVVVDPPNAEPFLMKVCIVYCTCDLPARASAQNLFNSMGYMDAVIMNCQGRQ